MGRGDQSSTETLHLLQAENGQEPLQPTQSSTAPLNREEREVCPHSWSLVTHGINDHSGACAAGPALLDGHHLVTWMAEGCSLEDLSWTWAITEHWDRHPQRGGILIHGVCQGSVGKATADLVFC